MISEKKIRMSIRDLLELHETVDACSKIMPSKGESHDFIRKFQYAMGRNMIRIQPLLKNARESYTAATVSDEGYEEYMDALAALDAESCDNGDKEKVEKRRNALKQKFRKAIKAQEKKEAEAEIILDEKVEVSLYHFAFDSLPIGIVGGWKVRLEPLLIGKPEIFSCT